MDADEMEMVRRAKEDGLRVSCDLSINHLHLTDVDIGDFESNCNLIPPLRSRIDLEALRAGLADGTIDAICSDHTPVDDDDKQLPFGEAAAGAAGAAGAGTSIASATNRAIGITRYVALIGPPFGLRRSRAAPRDGSSVPSRERYRGASNATRSEVPWRPSADRLWRP